MHLSGRGQRKLLEAQLDPRFSSLFPGTGNPLGRMVFLEEPGPHLFQASAHMRRNESGSLVEAALQGTATRRI